MTRDWYAPGERMEEAIQRQMEVYRQNETLSREEEEHENAKVFAPRRFPDRPGEKITRRRTREQIRHLIGL